ncbi:hypothetical protein FZEAL_3571 [Fusarium zealandicum]|uniref:Ankyrin repeat protein n=1 Tax=Fusarium zealandicum TaxID=1053134 RepID=A0A8H4UPD0_9HYPO|nr:hypothetical protein FZEAL_3571 [Fusarium zealandicum]
MRFISDDRKVEPKAASLQVLSLGLPRCATSSLQAALESDVLNFGPCLHMAHIVPHPEREQLVIDALDEQDVQKRQKILYKLYDGHASACDFPGWILSPDLMDMYPEAVVVLNKRKNNTAWVKSIGGALRVFGTWRYYIPCFLWKTDRLHYWMRQSAHARLRQNFGDMDMYSEDFYDEFYKWVRAEAKKRNMKVLEWEVTDGWEPLYEHVEGGVVYERLGFLGGVAWCGLEWMEVWASDGPGVVAVGVARIKRCLVTPSELWSRNVSVVEADDEPIARKLFEHCTNPDPNISGSFNQLLIYTAARNGNESMGRLLVDHNARVEQSRDIVPCVSDAAPDDDDEPIRGLIEAGLDLDELYPDTNSLLYNLLHSSSSRVPDKFRLLFELGARVDDKILRGNTYLTMAVLSGQVDTVRALLEHDTYPSLLEAYGKLLLQEVIDLQKLCLSAATYETMTEAPIAKGANVDLNNKCTPLSCFPSRSNV